MENVKSKRVGSPENAENEDGGSDKGLQGTVARGKEPPPLTPSLFNITLKYSVPEDRGEPGSLNTSTAELPQSAGPCEEMQLYLK